MDTVILEKSTDEDKLEEWLQSVNHTSAPKLLYTTGPLVTGGMPGSDDYIGKEQRRVHLWGLYGELMVFFFCSKVQPAE